MVDRYSEVDDKLKRKVIADVIARLRETGAVVALPRKKTLDNVISHALQGVFAQLVELAAVAEASITRAATYDPAPASGNSTLSPSHIVSTQRSLDGPDLIKDERDWLAFFEHCRVRVHNADVGREMMKKALGTASGFRDLVGALIEYRDLVVPLLEYPGIRLFGALDARPGKRNAGSGGGSDGVDGSDLDSDDDPWDDDGAGDEGSEVSEPVALPPELGGRRTPPIRQHYWYNIDGGDRKYATLADALSALRYNGKVTEWAKLPLEIRERIQREKVR